MLIHVSSLKIPLCYKVLVQMVKVKIDVHPLSDCYIYRYRDRVYVVVGVGDGEVWLDRKRRV